MKGCPTGNMNKAELWGFEVSHIVTSASMLAGSNILLNIIGLPLFISWIVGFGTLLSLRFVSHGQKNGHLELMARFILSPHIYLGHRDVCRQRKDL